ncbi:MAG: methyltransferase family protein [Candidatus Nanopelagicales bacterium]
MNVLTRGLLLVVLQVSLIVALLVLPQGQDWEVPGWVEVVLGLFSFVGLVLGVLFYFSLEGARSVLPAPKETGKLKTTGAYSVIRHPIYSLILVIGISVVIQHQSLLKIVIWLLLLSVLWIKANFEESLLRKKFPEYSNYALKVGKFVPKLNALRK